KATPAGAPGRSVAPITATSFGSNNACRRFSVTSYEGHAADAAAVMDDTIFSFLSAGAFGAHCFDLFLFACSLPSSVLHERKILKVTIHHLNAIKIRSLQKFRV